MKMRNWMLVVVLTTITAPALAGGVVVPSLAITELSTKSAEDPEDYFELTNLGSTAIDVTGWKFDDESASIDDAAPLEGVSSIAPGESVVIIQLGETDPLDANYNPAGDVATFRGYWGGLAGVQVGYHAGAGLGKGDGIVLFDSSDAIALEFYYGYGDTTDPDDLLKDTHAGDWGAENTELTTVDNDDFLTRDMYQSEAAVWVPGTDPQAFVLSAAGVYGSFENQFGEYGSPGITNAVPEPATCVLLAFAGAGLAFVRRR